MNTPNSIRARFISTAIFNAGKLLVSFLTGIVISRSLGPENCGNYTFLMGSFLGIRQLLDLGTSKAFYAFLCKQPRGRQFILSYFAWQMLQMGVTVLLIAILFPNQVIDFLWVGQERNHVLLAFISVFLSQQVVLTVTQIAESFRRTHRVQLLNFASAFVAFIIFFVAGYTHTLTLPYVFIISITVSIMTILFSFRFIPIDLSSDQNEELDWNKTIREYFDYSSPLAISMAVSCFYVFADNWLLQRYGGPRQQGFYSIANQFSVAGLLATNAMLNIFWKEFAEFHYNDNRETLVSFYERTTRILFMITAGICGILLPLSKEITLFFLGPSYIDGWPILAVMLFYPVHQTINHLTGTVFYATGKTKSWSMYSIAFMLLSVVISYFVQAPSTSHIPGLGMAGMGMAIKMVTLNVLGAIFTSIWLARLFSFRFDWEHQLIGVLLCFGLGTITVECCRLFIAHNHFSTIAAALTIGLSVVIYAGALCTIFWKIPQILGFKKGELKEILIPLYQGLRFLRTKE